jgi:hypothetical protein
MNLLSGFICYILCSIKRCANMAYEHRICVNSHENKEGQNENVSVHFIPFDHSPIQIKKTTNFNWWFFYEFF